MVKTKILVFLITFSLLAGCSETATLTTSPAPVANPTFSPTITSTLVPLVTKSLCSQLPRLNSNCVLP